MNSKWDIVSRAYIAGMLDLQNTQLIRVNRKEIINETFLLDFH